MVSGLYELRRLNFRFQKNEIVSWRNEQPQVYQEKSYSILCYPISRLLCFLDNYLGDVNKNGTQKIM
jgi:hypothetical protein